MISTTEPARSTDFEQVESAVSWFYYADLHTVACLPGEPGKPCLAIDLSVGEAGATITSRAVRAAERARSGLSPYPLPAAQLLTSPSDPWTDLSCRAVRLGTKTGTLEYLQGPGEFRSLTPLSDGKPAFRGARIIPRGRGATSWRSGSRTWRSHPSYSSRSRGAIVLGMLDDPGDPFSDGAFALSRDGRRFTMAAQRSTVRGVATSPAICRPCSSRSRRTSGFISHRWAGLACWSANST